MALPLRFPFFDETSQTTSEAASSYHPLPSVWEGEDADLLEAMLGFYLRQAPRTILDATINTGRFWRGTQRRIIGLDLERRVRPTVQGTNLGMPFRDSSFDVVVYDPPHVPNQGQDKEKDFSVRFGLTIKASREHAYNLSHLYGPFAAEACRVLVAEGMLFCKIADYVHNHRLQWAHVEMIRAAEAAGLMACDCIIKVRKGPIVDPKWKVAHHSRRRHAYWLVFRKSNKCE